VKVLRDAEAFWAQVRKVEGAQITATVANHLIYSDAHGLGYGDEMIFDRDEVTDWDPEHELH
jgi:hypothetical protein